MRQLWPFRRRKRAGRALTTEQREARERGDRNSYFGFVFGLMDRPSRDDKRPKDEKRKPG